MSDKEFQKKLDLLAKANETYKSLLKECENEIEKRFGIDPATADCDWWIDTFHTGSGTSTVEQIELAMTSYSRIDKLTPPNRK